LLERSHRHPSLLRSDHALLVVVDMQEPFLRAIWQPEPLLRNVTTLLEAARVLNVPVLATLQNAQRLGGVVEEVGRCLPKDCVPLDKLAFSAAADEKIRSAIQRSGRRQIVLCGIESHICISQTAHDLMAQGYQVHIVADAVSSRTEANWKLGLRRAETAGAILTTTESALYELLEEAGTSAFREVLKLVR
jgi:nicotinamidase-related amidase